MLLGLDTLTFLFLFLPASMLVFYLCPSKYKNASLAVMSLLFYASNDWKKLPILLLSLLFDYLVCSKLVRFGSNQKGRRTIFWSSILKNILLMVLAMAIDGAWLDYNAAGIIGLYRYFYGICHRCL